MRVAISLAVLALACTRVAAGQTFEFKMISSGLNRPGMPVWNSPYRDILIGLHTNEAPSDLAVRLGIDGARFAAILDSLRADGILKDVNHAPRPTCMVVTADEGARVATLALEIARQSLPFMRTAVQRARVQHPAIAGLSHLAFDDVSFFLASDVLLDNWQIGTMERRWLQAERPLRGKSRYYCAYLERTGNDREAFGIYGNQMMGLGQERLLGVYGNRRGRGSDLMSLRPAVLAELVALSDTTNRPALLNRLIDELQHAVRNRSDLRVPLAAGLAPMGLTRGTRPLFAVVDTADNRALSAMASSVADSLVTQLIRATPRLRDAWSASRWVDETTFEEFLIWWYHFFYTALTDQLAAEGAIQIPPTGLFHYLIVQ